VLRAIGKRFRKDRTAGCEKVVGIRFASDSALEQSGFELWVPPACDTPAATRFVADSVLEGDGFEPSVPGTKEPVFVAEGELRIAGTNGAAKKGCFLRGTDGSNPSPSSGESAANPARRVTSQTSSATASGFARNGGCVSKLGMQRFTAPEHGRLVAPDRVDLVHLASSSPWPKMLCFSRGGL
jgi:hypothetical protein